MGGRLIIEDFVHQGTALICEHLVTVGTVMGAMHCKNKFVKEAVNYDSPYHPWSGKEYFTTLIQKTQIFPLKALLNHYS